ncbi:MFS transporter [Kineococcus sp. LSe6-4]|uniref:MFS transporter n=1 Tax=Kineococcus halophytocola TaxID=3234027 RepID=A0ABV4GZ55_9ACTN
MSHPDQVVDPRALRALPGLRLVFTAATLARLSFATLVLSLLLTVQAATGSYAVAGTALGAYGIAGSTMPAKARLLDTRGPRRVLPLLSTLFALALLALALAARSGVGVAAVHVTGAAVAGLVAPPVGPTMRAVWARLTPDPAARQRAYSLDAVVESGVFAVGPVLAAVLVQAATPATALVCTAAAHLLGSSVMATSPLLTRPAGRAPDQPDAEPPAGSSRRRRVLGPLTRPGYPALLLFAAAVGLGNDPLEVAVVARGERAGPAVASGLLLAVLALSAAAGGLGWGRLAGTDHGRRLRDVPPWTVLAALAAVTSLAAAVAAVAPGLVWLAAALVVVGAASAPLAVVVYTAADRFGATDGGSEATSWVTTATNLGASLGTAAAGALIDVHGTAGAFWAGAAVTAVAGAGAWAYGHRGR